MTALAITSIVFAVVNLAAWVFYLAVYAHSQHDPGMANFIVGVPVTCGTALLAFVQLAWIGGGVLYLWWRGY